jgi:NAD(P)-dependent dehydrogenase (short-subunit alcohol dehydrogenase family)
MKTILITGGSRGLGLEFTKKYLAKGHQVYAASRKPATPELEELNEKYQNLHIHTLDVADETSRDELFQTMFKVVEKIDMLINNAGIASGNETFRYNFGELDQDDLCRTLLINSVAPLMVTEKFFPLLIKGDNPLVINISSDSGSISLKKHKGSYGYSSSKSALNMITKILSLELQEVGVCVIALHPGWVKTTMAYTENAPLEPEESIDGMMRVIETLNIEHTGSFLNWKGEEMPW